MLMLPLSPFLYSCSVPNRSSFAQQSGGLHASAPSFHSAAEARASRSAALVGRHTDELLAAAPMNVQQPKGSKMERTKLTHGSHRRCEIDEMVLSVDQERIGL